MVTITRTDGFDPATEAELQRLEDDAAAAAFAERRVLSSISISRYFSDGSRFMATAVYRLASGEFESENVATDATISEAFLALAKVVADVE